MGSMAAGNPVPVFANMDFWTQIVEQHPEFFARVGRLQEAARSIVDPAYEGLDGGQQMQMNMLMLTAIGVAEIVTLVGNGMGHGAMKIVRGVMENAINMEYMRQFPDQAEKYLEWQWVEQHKLHKHLEESSPAMLRKFRRKSAIRMKPSISVSGHCSNIRFEPNGGTKTKMQDGWCREDLFHRAERVGLAQSYRTVMPSANQILHGTISGWIRDLDEVTRRIEYPPTHKWGGEALIAAHMALIQAIETASLTLNATPTPSLDTLKEDFQAAWGENPPKISEAAEHAEIAPEPIEEDEDGEESE